MHKSISCFFVLFIFSSILFSHSSEPLRNIFLVACSKLMISDAGRVVWYVNFAHITPFVSLTYPVLQKREKHFVINKKSIEIIRHKSQPNKVHLNYKTQVKKKINFFVSLIMKYDNIVKGIRKLKKVMHFKNNKLKLCWSNLSHGSKLGFEWRAKEAKLER